MPTSVYRTSKRALRLLCSLACMIHECLVLFFFSPSPRVCFFSATTGLVVVQHEREDLKRFLPLLPVACLPVSRSKRHDVTSLSKKKNTISPSLASLPPISPRTFLPRPHPPLPLTGKQPFLREELLLRLAEMLLCVLKQLVSGRQQSVPVCSYSLGWLLVASAVWLAHPEQGQGCVSRWCCLEVSFLHAVSYDAHALRVPCVSRGFLRNCRVGCVGFCLFCRLPVTVVRCWCCRGLCSDNEAESWQCCSL